MGRRMTVRQKPGSTSRGTGGGRTHPLPETTGTIDSDAIAVKGRLESSD